MAVQPCLEWIPTGKKKKKKINDDKRLQTFDKITAYPHGTNTFKVCESEMLSKI